MKTKEEIEQLAFKSYGDGFLKGSFIHGYTQCQKDMADKKYTEEDMLKSFWAGVDCEADNGKNFEQFINSLNKQD
jgi:hypothetical protein